MSSRSVQYTSSPLLASKTPIWRSQFIVACIALGFLGLVARAAYVQLIDNAFFKRQGAVRHVRTLDLPANRGRILDRNGHILASSVPVPSIWANPENIDRDPEKFKSLAKLLGMTQAELENKLSDEDKNFVWLKRQVDESTAKSIEILKIKGIYARKEYKRIYPEGEAVAHVVGFTNVENIGQEGIEREFNKDLGGKPGTRRVIKDKFGKVVEDIGEIILPEDGKDLQLSIDSKAQYFAYEKIKEAVITNRAKAGSVVVLHAITGEVIAMTNYPSFVPDRRGNLVGEQLRNRALTDTFEPGSVMKPFTIGLALDSGRVTPASVIQTAPGSMNLTGTTIRDAHPHGALTVEQVIQVSSNVGTTKIAMQMQPQEMWETFSQAGFGQKPPIAFPGVVSGRLRPYKTWRPIEQATMSYGYGLSASLFQMARSYTVFSHDGQIIPVTFLKNDTPVVGEQVFSANTATQVRKMLQMAAGPGGTGMKAQTMGYSVGGKSGTADKQVGKTYGSEKNRKYRGWFVGMAPIDKPLIIVAVMLDEPSNGRYYGGDVAAPVFSEVVQQTLRMMRVQPDIAVKPMVVTQLLEKESF
jgi:cell division protein FtsI (penicillin-binding protein 3)